MDDLSKKLNDLLNSPDGLQKLQQAAASLGALSGNSSSEPPQEPEIPDNFANALSSLNLSGDAPLGEMDAIMKLMPLLNDMKKDDENTVLLKALRPYLQDKRQNRLDESLKMMRLLKVLPFLTDKGIF